LSGDAPARRVASGHVVAAVAALVALLALCSFPLQAPAREAEVRGALRTTSLYNTELGATVLDARLSTDLEFGPFTVGAVWRGYHLSDESYNPRGIEYPQPKIKHRYAELSLDGMPAGGTLVVRAGHFFSTFDRGLSLRSFEEVDLETDTALDGILGEYEAGGVKVSALSGKTRVRVSNTSYREYKAEGGRVAFTKAGRVSVGASALARSQDLREDEPLRRVRRKEIADKVLGGETEVWLGPVHLAGDYVYREGDDYLASGGADGATATEICGHGGYVTGMVSTALVTALGEYKDYSRIDNALVNPPTCLREHASTLMNRVTHEVNLRDERGFFAEGTLTAVDGMPMTLSASEARLRSGDLTNWEMYGRVERELPKLGATSLETAWSREYETVSGLGKFDEHVTAMFDTGLEGEAGPVVEIGLGGQRAVTPRETYENWLASLSWYARQAVTVSAVAEATTEGDLERDFWLFAEVSLALGDGLDASLGVGTERGGKKCSGGVCYTEPEFTGVRMRLAKTF
jgi:hypothetical protein